jgi:anti-sigma B factor antagonist
MSNLRVVIEQRGKKADIAVVQVHGPLDTVAAYTFSEKMNTLMEAGMSRFVIDFEHLEYISSAGIGVFPGMGDELQARRGGLVFAHVPDKIYKIFAMIGLTTLFHISDTVEHAIEELDDDE